MDARDHRQPARQRDCAENAETGAAGAAAVSAYVFGYGSLMWDGWETSYSCLRKHRATLHKYRRDFNKASVKRWGSHEVPGPTLGLTASAGDVCIGYAFEFPAAERDRITDYLKKREGSSFSLDEIEIELAEGKVINAIVPVNDLSASTFIGEMPLEERAALARTAHGEGGACLDYVRNVRKLLAAEGIQDRSVEEFWATVLENCSEAWEG